MIPFFPKKFATQATIAYLVGLGLCSVLYYRAALPLWLMLFGMVSVVAFFYYANRLTMQWRIFPTVTFEKKLLSTAFLIRLGYVLFIYWFNNAHYGTYYESSIGDIGFYVSTSVEGVELYERGITELISLWRSWRIDWSDLGYIIYLTTLYKLTGLTSTVVLPLIIKAGLGAATCLFTYRIARRHFGEEAAKMTGIFCMLQANLIWWCGSMMKETEMVFVLMLFMDQADALLQGHSQKTWRWAYVALLGLVVLSFRGALAMVAYAAVSAGLVMANSRIVSFAKKAFAALLIGFVVMVGFGESIQEEFKTVTTTVQDGSYQQRNMEWRTQRENGNKFADLAGKAVFAPLIFTIPFPTVNYTREEQEMQVMVSGGNFEKNVLSFFVILTMFTLLFNGEWRQHVFPVSLLCGYMCAMALSVFAQSGRFHVPALPLEMMFAAYGITRLKLRQIRWFNYALFIEVIAMVAWGWFKLKGQGVI